MGDREQRLKELNLGKYTRYYNEIPINTNIIYDLSQELQGKIDNEKIKEKKEKLVEHFKTNFTSGLTERQYQKIAYIMETSYAPQELITQDYINTL